MQISHKNKDLAKKVITDMVIIICVAVVIALATNWMRPQRVTLIDKSKFVEEDITVALLTNELTGLNPIGSKLAYEKSLVKNLVFVDVRSLDEYDRGHIRGAINVPLADYATRFEWFSEKYPPDTIIVTYCDAKNCEMSEAFGAELVFAGYQTVYYLENGFMGWDNSHLPIKVNRKRGLPF